MAQIGHSSVPTPPCVHRKRPRIGSIIFQSKKEAEKARRPPRSPTIRESGFFGVVVADLQFRSKPLAIAPRQILRPAINDWKNLGFTTKLGIELEAYVTQPDGQSRRISFRAVAL